MRKKRRSLAAAGFLFTAGLATAALSVKEIYGEAIVEFTVSLAGLDDRFKLQELRMSVAEKTMQKMSGQSVITGGRYSKLSDKINKLEVQQSLYASRTNAHVTAEIKKLREDLGQFGDAISADLSRSQSLYLDLRDSINYMEAMIIGQRINAKTYTPTQQPEE